MTSNFSIKAYGIGRVALLLVFMLVLGSPLFADLPYPVTDTLETDPATEGWTFASDANGSAGWDATQGVSGTHSIKLSHAGGGWNYFAEKATVRMTTGTVPQTGKVEVSFQIKYTALEDPTNHQYVISFGDTGYPQPGGIGDILVVGINGANKTLTVADGEGVWLSLSYQMPQNTWVKMRVVFNQDLRTYDLYAFPSGGSETQVRTNKPLISQATAPNAKFGDGGAGAGSAGTHNDVVFSASPDPCTFYIDDFSVQSPYPPFFTEDFETDPFASRWHASDSQETWVTEQSVSPTHSIKLTQTGGWAYFAHRVYTTMTLNAVPQTDIVEVSWNVRYSFLPADNQHYLMSFGYTDNPPDGIGDILTIFSSPAGAGIAKIATSDGDGHLIATAFSIPLDTWFKLRVVFHQTSRTYDLYAKPAGQAEVQLRSARSLVTGSAKFGDATHRGLVSAASIDCTYYLDDFSISAQPDSGPAPTPTPLPFAYPGSDNYEGNPFDGTKGGRWKIVGDGITTSTAQYLSGSTSIKIVGQNADPSYSDSPRLVADLQGVPQTGKVEVKLATYFESLDLHNACQFLNFGSQITQGDGYHIITVGYLSGNTTLRVFDSLGWDTPATTISLQLNTWYRHRFIFDQDAKTYSYFIQVGSDPEVEYIHDEFTRDTKLGEAPYTFFSSIPFTTTTYYVDDFSINEPGAQPPVNRVGDSWELY